MDPDLEKHIPNKYHTQPTLFGTINKRAWMHGMVLLAIKDIGDDEELLLNYRINPKSTARPEWYHSCDEKGDERRWAK